MVMRHPLRKNRTAPAHDAGDALRYHRQKLDQNAGMGARPFTALTLHEYASMLVARDAPGDRERALGFLRQALVTAKKLGMHRLSEKAEALRLVIESTAATSPPMAASASSNLFQKGGDYWTIAYEGKAFRLKDSLGLCYIAYLLQQPGRKIAVTELAASAEGVEPDSIGGATLEAKRPGAEFGPVRSGLGDAGEILDAEARAAYRRRAEELREGLREAKAFNDLGRVERLQREMDFLLQELAAATGPGGRLRKAASITERARQNVTRAIRAAIERIAEHGPALARHLEKTIETGSTCSYAADPATSWTL